MKKKCTGGKLAANGINRNFNLLDKKKKSPKKIKIMLAEKQNYRKQLKGQETTGKTSRNKNNKGRARNRRKAGPFRK